MGPKSGRGRDKGYSQAKDTAHVVPRGPKSPGGVLRPSLEPETRSRRCDRNGSTTSRKPQACQPWSVSLSRPWRPRNILDTHTFPESQRCSPRNSPHCARGKAETREEQGLPKGHLPRLGPKPPRLGLQSLFSTRSGQGSQSGEGSRGPPGQLSGHNSRASKRMDP